MATKTLPAAETVEDLVDCDQPLGSPDINFALMDMGILRGRPFRAWERSRIVKEIDDFLSQAADGARTVEALLSKISFRDAVLGQIEIVLSTGLPVGAAEETLLMVVVALVGLKEDSEDHYGGTLSRRDVDHSVEVTALKVSGHAAAQPLMKIRVRRSTMIRLLGLSNAGGSAKRDVARRLDLLSRIVYSVKMLEGNRRVVHGGSGLLSYRIELDDEDGDTWIDIVLAERIARAIMGKTAYVLPGPVEPQAWEKSKVARGLPAPKNKSVQSNKKDDAQEALRIAENIATMKAERQYDRIDLRERLALKSDLAQLLHSILSYRFPLQDARKRKGRRDHLIAASPVRFDALAKLLFPPGKVSPEATRKRYERIRKALNEISILPGWEVEILAQSHAVQVSRWSVDQKAPTIDSKGKSLGITVTPGHRGDGIRDEKTPPKRTGRKRLTEGEISENG